MIEVSFCAEQQLVETVTLFREHPVLAGKPASNDNKITCCGRIILGTLPSSLKEYYLQEASPSIVNNKTLPTLYFAISRFRFPNSDWDLWMPSSPPPVQICCTQHFFQSKRLSVSCHVIIVNSSKCKFLRTVERTKRLGRDESILRQHVAGRPI